MRYCKVTETLRDRCCKISSIPPCQGASGDVADATSVNVYSFWRPKVPARRSQFGLLALRLPPQADQTSRPCDAPSGRRGRSQLRQQILPREARLQFLGVQLGRDQDERVVVRSAWAGAWSNPDVLAGTTLAADEFRRRLVSFALLQAGDIARDAIGHPVNGAGAPAGLGIDHGDRKALGAI